MRGWAKKEREINTDGTESRYSPESTTRTKQRKIARIFFLAAGSSHNSRPPSSERVMYIKKSNYVDQEDSREREKGTDWIDTTYISRAASMMKTLFFFSINQTTNKHNKKDGCVDMLTVVAQL